MDMQTENIADKNYKVLKEMFPNAFTESINANGDVVRAIDIDVLKSEINCDLINEKTEKYQFTWPDKAKARILSNQPISSTLRPIEEDSIDFETTNNVYIEGDNLDVLKLLQETYLNKIKMIYIDPPYNTGNDFVYADDFSVNKEEYILGSGQYDEYGMQMVQNTETNGRFHTDWLNMIYPRIRLAKDLLSDDGVIFISIDDKEVCNLRKICDEVFGERNFVSNFIWQSRTSISNDFEVSLNHNHTLIYSKNREKLLFGGDKIDSSEYINPDNDPRGPWKLVPIDANHAGGDTVYPVVNPKTGVEYLPPNGRIWCYNRDTMQKLLDDGRIKFGLNDNSAPKRKLYLNERIEKGDKKTPSSIILDAGTTKDGTTEIMNLFDGEKVFDYPKPVNLIYKLIQYGAPKGGIVLDFFSGSATTAQAVMKYNIENDTNISYILVQIPENLDESYDKASSSGKKTIKTAMGFLDKIKKPHYLTEVSKERIKRAGKKLADSNKKEFDKGFRCFKLDTSNMKDIYYNPAEIQQTSLFDMADNIKEDRTSEDLLFQVMLDLGVMLSSKVERIEIADKEVFNVADGFLIACFDADITEEVVKEIAHKKPYYAVFRDSSLANDSVATNFDQIFASISPDTVRKVL